jgi:hypothetical protein
MQLCCFALIHVGFLCADEKFDSARAHYSEQIVKAADCWRHITSISLGAHVSDGAVQHLLAKGETPLCCVLRC